MKFKEIKVDDFVLINKKIHSWSFTKNFIIRKKVFRVTDKQFVIEDGSKVDKKNGKILGTSGYAYLMSEKNDETEKFIEFYLKFKRCYNLSKFTLDFERILEMSQEEINEVERVFEKLIKIKK